MALLLTLGTALPALSLPTQPMLLQVPSSGNSNNSAAVGWVMLDGQDVFQVAAPQPALSNRQRSIEENLQTIRDRYLQQAEPRVHLSTAELDSSSLPSVYVNGYYLMTVTEMDARMQGTTPRAIVEDLSQTLRRTLQAARRERQPVYLRRMGMLAGMGGAVAIALALALQLARKPLLHLYMRWFGSDSDDPDRQRSQLRDLLQLMLSFIQALMIAAVSVWILGLFAQTRPVQNSLLTWIKVPLVLAIIIVVAYVGIRLSYLVVDWFVAQLRDRDGFNRDGSRRLALRTETIASVIKNIANFVWIGIGTMIALALFGVNLGIVLASFGLIGLELSLVTQSLL
ncbi:MAG: mechanosensitive ion channel family protein, partial [Leptolyngbya sp. SIO4C1]|nr:mechanosensitive ion channel family protein [Leptolyngbya sp. SIO4C1]